MGWGGMALSAVEQRRMQYVQCGQGCRPPSGMASVFCDRMVLISQGGWRQRRRRRGGADGVGDRRVEGTGEEWKTAQPQRRREKGQL